MTPSVCRSLFVVICAVVAAALLSQTFSIPAPRFEPVGGARVPQVAAVLVIILCAAAAGAVLFRRSRDGADAGTRADRRGFVFVVIFLAYAFGLSSQVIGFGWLTAAFLIALQWLYGPRDRRQIVTSILLCLAAFTLEYVFTSIFVIDLARSF